MRLLMMMLAAAVVAQAATLTGVVKDDCGCVLQMASVRIENSRIGAITDAAGRFEISNLEPGRYSLSVSMLGFETVRQEVVAADSQIEPLVILLGEEPIQMGEVQIETERTLSGVADDEIVRTEVIHHGDLIARSTSGNLMSALDGQTGLKTRPCAMCGSCGIGMQGLEPSYTEVNLDGLPVYSGLGTLYGLDGISVGDVERMELVKGSGSSLQGSGAIAGSVNLVSVESERARSFEARATSDQFGQSSLYVAGSGISDRYPMQLSISLGVEPDRLDQDSDGLTDRPQYRRSNIYYSVDIPVRRSTLRLGTRAYWENRFAGELRWSRGDRGSSEIYAREILTRRQELNLQWSGARSGSWLWSARGALVHHEQDSWYGTRGFDATQQLGLFAFTVDRAWSERHSTTFEGGVNAEEYNDNLELNRETDLSYAVPQFVVQHSWLPHDNWTLQAGNRTEYYEQDGTILTPRATLAWDAAEQTTFRLAGGLGYRPVTLFTLDAATEAGFENVEMAEDLKAERSAAVSLSASQRWVSRFYSARLDVNVFHTEFQNKAVVELGEGSSFVYSNSPDAFSRGFELQAQWHHRVGWKLVTGLSRSQVRFRSNSEWHDAELQYTLTADATVGRTWTRAGITADLTANVLGPQHLPEGRGRDKSPTYALWDASLRKQWSRFQASFGVKNIFEYTQSESPYYFDSLGHLHPDTALFYAPVLGRTYVLGLGYSFGS